MDVRKLFKALGVIVGGSPVRKGVVTFSVVLGTAGAVSGSCGSCTPVAPPEPPTAVAVTTESATSSSTSAGPTTTATSSSSATTGGDPVQPECLFVRPKGAARASGRVPESRIVGGTPALPGEAPWMASLQRPTSPTGPGAHFCGGAVYGGRYVLTAAHCVENTGRMRVVVGRRDLRTAEGWEFAVESSTDVLMPAREGADGELVGLYDSQRLDWDVALLDLGGPAGVDSLDLHDGALRNTDGTPKSAQAFGWGRVYSGGPIAPALQKIDDVPPIIPQDTCRGFYDNLTERMICSDKKGSGSCQGDSGGPLLVDGKRVGVVSFGVGCADGWPGVYAYVGAAQSPWSTGALGYSGELAEWVRTCTQ